MNPIVHLDFEGILTSMTVVTIYRIHIALCLEFNMFLYSYRVFVVTILSWVKLTISIFHKRSRHSAYIEYACACL